jgi:hypothetical protein
MGRQSSKQAIAWFVTWLAISRGAVSKAAHTPHVNSTSGLIIGHQAPDRPDAFEFLGIKYGRAPVGELRFAPPERYTASANNVYNASNWVSVCNTFGRVQATDNHHRARKWQSMNRRAFC